MRRKERTFFEKGRRYLEPFFKARKESRRTLLIYSLWWINPVIHIIFIQKLVLHLENWLRSEFISVFLYYIAFCFVYEFLDFMWRKWWWVENVNAYRRIIDSKYINKFIKADNNAVEKEGTGKMVSVITWWTDIWALSLDRFTNETTRISFIFLYAFFMVFSIWIYYGLFFIVLYVSIFVLWFYTNSKSLIYRRRRNELWNEYVKTYVRIIMSKLEIMQSWKSKLETKWMEERTLWLTEQNLKMATWVHWCYRSAESSAVILKIIIFWYVWLWILDGTFTLSFFIGLFWIITLLESTIIQSISFLRNFSNDFTKIEKLWDFFDHTPEMKGYDIWDNFKIKTWNISFENISYWYEKNNLVFNNFDLQIKGWKISALVWPSGWGKSTLVKLIAGYIHTNSWDIIIDKQSIQNISLKSYYKEIWYLTQEPSVFDGSIRENLWYSIDKKVSDKELSQALRSAWCDFVFDFEKEIDTEIWEKGIRLSWWQRQRIAIAKIFLKNPKIIILDEPTSALDSFSEAKIADAMEKLFKWRTVIVIAHRLQTVKHADDIIYLANGKIIERGNHSELVKQEWLYKQMLDLQSGF